MNPALLLRERRFQFGDVTARQGVSVLGTESDAYLYVCTTCTVRLSEKVSAVHAKGSSIAFADADQLNDEGRREQIAREHLAKLADELRAAAELLSAALAPKLEAVAQ